MLSSENISDSCEFYESNENPGDLMENGKMYIKYGLSARRPTAIKLEPININCDTCDTNSLASTSLIVASKSVNYIDIGFSNLSYTVKTGIWKRG